jgi:SAM-dependent methyltransferase
MEHMSGSTKPGPPRPGAGAAPVDSPGPGPSGSFGVSAESPENSLPDASTSLDAAATSLPGASLPNAARGRRRGRGSGASATWWGGPVRAEKPADRLSGLAQGLVGEAVLQHVAGRRVLDLGEGSPEITRWARPLCASLDSVDLRTCTDERGEIRLPQEDAAYEVVYSLRTVAHLGHDEASSDLGVQSLLAEAARVTVPGGLILVDINNPRSLRGFFYGIRRPITVVSTGKVVLADEHRRVTRHDTLARLLRISPACLDVLAVYGIRVLVPISRALQIPLLGRLLAAGEWWARDSILRGFGAHLLVALRKDEDAGRTPG